MRQQKHSVRRQLQRKPPGCCLRKAYHQESSCLTSTWWLGSRCIVPCWFILVRSQQKVIMMLSFIALKIPIRLWFIWHGSASSCASVTITASSLPSSNPWHELWARIHGHRYYPFIHWAGRLLVVGLYLTISSTILLCGVCYLEPYTPSRFARQFGYDQLYVGNPNHHLGYAGSLSDGARAWKYFVTRCTGACFCMPLRVPNLVMSMGFCQWYIFTNSNVAEFKQNTSGLKLIVARMKKKVVAWSATDIAYLLSHSHIYLIINFAF